MTLSGWAEILIVLGLVLAAGPPLGHFMACVFSGDRNRLAQVFGPAERVFYRIAGVDPEQEQTWLEYTMAMLVFSAGCFVELYLIQRFQTQLPVNPTGQDMVAPDLAFNTAISFLTNANWQAYAGETTMSHFTQMLGLTVQNFLDSGVAIGLALALTRAFARYETALVGNFWVDLTRATLYVLLPMSIVLALVFVALGCPQTLHGSVVAKTLEGIQQTISIGPVASQEAIKLVGNNGGGFFNANSAHPFENPSVWSNMLQNWAQLVLPVAFIFAFGRLVGDRRQGVSLLAAMAVIFIVSLVTIYHSEAAGNPNLTAIGVDPALGNLEGKDLRFSQAGDALFVAATTGTGTGAANPALDSLMPIAGLVPLLNLLMGCVAPGGVGSGLYSMLMMVVVTVFLSGLMVGRTPEYLGKKIEAREMLLAVLALLVQPILILGFTAVAVNVSTARASLGNAGPHGLTEILYAYASTSSDNGSAFSGLSSNTLWFNITTGLSMFLGRFAHVIPLMAIAGAIAIKRKSAGSAGTLPTHGPMFVVLLVSVIVIVTLLQFFPAVALGPIFEQIILPTGRLY